ncbi:MAG: sulfatase [Planctomycetota bacterium]
MSQPPNILYLHTHDSGRMFSPFGGASLTPHLQRLADEGVCYRRAFCVGPTCSPSRAALFTGRYPHQVGQFGLSNFGYPLARPDQHLVPFLQQHGYRAALMGVQHVTRDERDLGYDHVRPDIVGGALGLRDPQMTSGPVVDAACEWLDQHGQDGPPWFLDAGVVDTHSNAMRQIPPEDEPGEAQIDRASPIPWLADLPEMRHWRSRFDVMARSFDHAVGRIIATLDRLGLAENTLVIYTTDHGPGVPLAKCTLTDAGLGVGLIVRGPGGYDTRHVVHDPVSHLDVFPTVCAAAGLDTPGWLEGQPLPKKADDDSTDPRPIFAEINTHGRRSLAQPERCVRRGRYKLVRRWYPGPEPIQGNADPTPVKEALTRDGWPAATQQGQPTDHAAIDSLYDLHLDPLERRDRSQEPDHHEAQRQLGVLLDDWMRNTDDPLAPGGPGIPEPQPFETVDPNRHAYDSA